MLRSLVISSSKESVLSPIPLLGSFMILLSLSLSLIHILASRTKSKCDKFKEELQDKTSTKITTAQVDANSVPQLVELINREKPDIVINVCLLYTSDNKVIFIFLVSYKF